MLAVMWKNTCYIVLQKEKIEPPRSNARVSEAQIITRATYYTGFIPALLLLDHSGVFIRFPMVLLSSRQDTRERERKAIMEFEVHLCLSLFSPLCYLSLEKLSFSPPLVFPSTANLALCAHLTKARRFLLPLL